MPKAKPFQKTKLGLGSLLCTPLASLTYTLACQLWLGCGVPKVTQIGLTYKQNIQATNSSIP